MPCTPMWWAFDVHTSTCYIITRFWSTLRPTYHHGKSARRKWWSFWSQRTLRSRLAARKQTNPISHACTQNKQCQKPNELKGSNLLLNFYYQVFLFWRAASQLDNCYRTLRRGEVSSCDDASNSLYLATNCMQDSCAAGNSAASIPSEVKWWT